MRHWIRLMVISLTVLGAASFSTVQSATVDGGAIDAGVQSTLKSFYAQNPGNRDIVSHAAGVLVFPRVT